jgi:class 3 adenylate cyclase/tetratricopeptide (TPR) repeat protein
MRVGNLSDVRELLASGSVGIRELHGMWDKRVPVPEAKAAAVDLSGDFQIPWMQEDFGIGRDFTAAAMKLEEYLLVCDAGRELLRMPSEGGDGGFLAEVRLNYAQALGRLGNTQEACRELERLLVGGGGLEAWVRKRAYVELGNVHAQEARRAVAAAARFEAGKKALSFWKNALGIEPDDLETLANVAGISLLLAGYDGEFARVAKEHGERISLLSRESKGGDWESCWARAVGFAVLGKVDEAGEAFGLLKSVPGVTTGQLAEARVQAGMLAEALGRSQDDFRSAFPALQLVVFAGYAPDNGVDEVRFPMSNVAQAQEDIAAILEKMDVRVGLAGAAAGADLLFLNALQERGSTAHVVLPWSRGEFQRTSILPYEGEEPFWSGLFESVIEKAATMRELGQAYEPASDVGWRYTMEVTAGIALHTARVSQLDLKPMAFCVNGDRKGGTANFCRFWEQELNMKVEVLEPPPIEVHGAMRKSSVRVKRCEQPLLQQGVKSMLFADLVGYSKLTENVIPELVNVFMARVSKLAANSLHSPISLNTWGDAIYAVFDYAVDAGAFALELTQMVEEGRGDWIKSGLYYEEVREEGKVKQPIRIRVGLHTGPVFMTYDPVVRQRVFNGAHVNRAARIEPVARPGEVFASEEFMALSELSRAESERRGEGTGGAVFACEYAGSMRLAKGYPGRFRIYRLLPERHLEIEILAKVIHELYRYNESKKGVTPETNPSVRPWDDLSEDLREANRAQAAHIPVKLRLLGYEFASGHGMKAGLIEITKEQLEELSIIEHDRWMSDRVRKGWKFGLGAKDEARKTHPNLVPWEDLSEEDKQKDRDAVLNMRQLIEKADMYVRKLSGV